ncbi:MAG: FtsW/RodA/SpoVE family cell cycle protein [Ignavibacteria bacterium]|nr:FtsW/RodA/SpoVE family cell cycle protein [Ignavibacteria bacterium]
MSFTTKYKVDWILFISVTILMMFSISAVYSSSTFYAEYKFGEYDVFFWNHIRNVSIAFALMFLFSVVDYSLLKKLANFLLYFSVILLLLVLFFSIPVKGASRWLDIGIANFQPSEIAKFSLIVYIAKIISERVAIKDEFLFVPMPIFIWIFLISFLIALQPNFSTSLIISTVSLLLLFVAKIKIKYIFRFFVIILIIGSILGISESYRIQRISGFFEFLSSQSETHATYQTNQALIAIGNGGILGLGPGKTQQGRMFLPESYGDYIFSIIGEEYGFVGLLSIILLLAITLFRIYKIAIRTTDLFAFVFASGIFLFIATFSIVNIFVNIGFLPSTGVPMPFISYGGSAIFIYGISVGVVQNIHISIKREEYEF